MSLNSLVNFMEVHALQNLHVRHPANGWHRFHSPIFRDGPHMLIDERMVQSEQTIFVIAAPNGCH